MILLQILGESLGTIVGGILIAGIFCWLCWHAFKLVRHPEWGAPAGLIAVLLLWHQGIGRSPFFKMALCFAVLGALALWPVGRAWRRQNILDRPDAREGNE